MPVPTEPVPTHWRQGRHLLDGPAGAMEVLVDAPAGAAPRGVAIVGHPQPLLGGSALHKVPHVLARATADSGWLVVRPNFRGVGQSAGGHDAGDGETGDLLWLAGALRADFPCLPLALVGFSFGAFVQARVAAALQRTGHPANAVFLAGLPDGPVAGGRHYDTPRGLVHARVAHGEHDERVPLAAVLDWARPTGQAVAVVPGTDHFFTGHLPALRELLLDTLARVGISD
jgi:uncharacterized protein